MRTVFYIFLLIVFVVSSCNLNNPLKDPTTVISQALDRAVNELSAESANLQQVMKETLEPLNNLTDETSAIIRGDISNAFQRGISAASGEMRCDFDFVRNRLRQSLERLKAEVLKHSIPDVELQICNVVPAAIEMALNPNQRNRLEFFGYDFDLTDVKALLLSGTTQTDVTQFLSKTTHYHMVLNLGNNGINLNSNSAKIVLRSKGIDHTTGHF